MKLGDIKPLTKDEEENTIERIKSYINLYHNWLYSFDMKTMYKHFLNFGRLKKLYPELQKELEETIYEDTRKRKQNEEENKIKTEIWFYIRNEQNLDLKILKQYSTEFWDVIIIWFPYFNIEKKKTSFKHSREIKKNLTPKFYQYILDNFTFYIE